MALVCDTKSDAPEVAAEHIDETDAFNEDLEDGEIEDDEEEIPPADTIVATTEPIPSDDTTTTNIVNTLETAMPQIRPPSPNNKFSHINRSNRFDRVDRHNNRHEDRNKRNHLTEAEKSVMHLHKLERLEREKRDKYKREQTSVVDDFASNIEKAIASILKKDKQKSDEEFEEDEKRGKKRKKKDKDKKKVKQRKTTSPPPDNFDTNDTNFKLGEIMKIPSPAYSDSYDSNSSTERKHDYSSRKRPHAKPQEKTHQNDKKHKSGKNREQKTELNKTADGGICLFYLQGKCNMGDDCLFSHDVQVPMKLELCKFYVMECCAKGDNCSYMHSSFPCKFYHMGLLCRAGDTCKYAHGKPLNDGLKQILFKHIETAPKEILGDFPRLNREGTLTMLNQAQKVLDVQYGGEKAEMPSIPKLLEMNIPMPPDFMLKDLDAKMKDRKERNKPSRWQDPDPSDQTLLDMNFGVTGFYTERGDQDMRITSNGDIDMRTLPNPINALLQNVSANILAEAQQTGDTDIRGLPPQDTDIRFEPPLHLLQNNGADVEEPKLDVSTEDDASTDDCLQSDFPPSLPKKQRELFLRIQSQQKDTLVESTKSAASDEDKNIDWYSDDDDDGRLMIKDDVEEPVKKAEEQVEMLQLPPDIKPVEVLEKLGDLSKIDISVEVTKLLSSLSQSGALGQQTKEAKPATPEPVVPKPEPTKQPQPIDPRKLSRESNEHKKTDKLSIYEQGSISLEGANKDMDFRNLDLDLRIGTDLDFRPTPGRPDVDLRHLGLPFKPLDNTPASEIDASIQSHRPIPWSISLVHIPKPDYTGLKLSVHGARNTGDPRLRKIFRLSIEEKESPASPKETMPAMSSPKATTPRIDPRLRKTEEKPALDAITSQMNYSQQLTMLQGSAFYQSLTSNQKLLLNQELSEQVDNNLTNANDPILNGILSNLGLLPGSASVSANPNSVVPNINTTDNSDALNILSNVNNLQFLSPIVNTLAQTMAQQSSNLGIAQLPTDFQLNFDPRQGGLLGNAPPFSFNDSSNYNNSNNFNEDYYDEPVVHNTGARGRGGRGGGYRDRQHQNRRGRNFNNRHTNSNRSFRNRNRNNNNINSNRGRTSP